MTSFDDRFADRVRAVFDAYEEPVDPEALARLQAALDESAVPSRGPASDRPPARRSGGAGARVRRRSLVALAALLAVGASGWLAVRLAERPGPDRPPLAEQSPAEPSARPAAPAGGDAAEDADAAARPTEDPTSTPLPDRRAKPPAGQAQPLAGPQPAGGLLRDATAERAEIATADGRPSAPRAAAAGAVLSPDSLAPQAPGVEDPVSASGRAGASGRETMVALASRPADRSVPARRIPDALPLPVAPVVLAHRRVPDSAVRPAVRVVVTTASAFARRQRAEGGGVSAGLARDWRLARGVSVSGAAVASYRRVAFEPESATAVEALAFVERDPTLPVDVTTQSTLTTVALEIPLDVTVDVVQTSRGRVGVSTGLTSALYLAQTFEDEGQRVSGEFVTSASTGRRVLALSSQPFTARETGALGRLDLARQLNVGLAFTAAGARPLAVDVYARLPLGGLTSRDVALTTLGVRLRVPLR